MPTLPTETCVNAKRTRFVLILDTHSTYPKLPPADVVIHAGDATNQGSYSELKKTLDWLDKADAEAKIIIAGNHDVTLDKEFYAEHGLNIHNQHPQSPEDCIALMISYPGIVYLNHTSALIRLASPNGPHTFFRVFGSPYVPARGTWAFGYDQGTEVAAKLWRDIPLDTDIVVTHTPAYNHRDASPKWGAAGCEELRKALWRVRPKLAVCGHVHEARGCETVTWRKNLALTPFMEESTVQWCDPGAKNKKLSLLDLTSRSGKPLLNDGSVTRAAFENNVAFFTDGTGDDDAKAVESERGMATFSSLVGKETATPGDVSPQAQHNADAEEAAVPGPSERGQASASSHGQISRLDREHVASLSGRQGRKQTCIVNAAIMAKSWGKGPKESNKPIVVDVDLPVWEEGWSEGYSFAACPTEVLVETAPIGTKSYAPTLSTASSLATVDTKSSSASG